MRLHYFQDEDGKGRFINLDKVEAVLEAEAYGPYKGPMTSLTVGDGYFRVRGDYQDVAKIVGGVEA